MIFIIGRLLFIGINCDYLISGFEILFLKLKMADQAKKLEEKRIEEENRRQAEEEFLRKHQRETKMRGGLSRSPSGSSVPESESDVEGKKRSRGEMEVSPTTKKKKKAETEEEEDLALGEDHFENIDIGLEKMVEWLRNPTINKLITRPQQAKFKGIVYMLRQELVKCREDRARLETRIEERGSLVDVVRKTVKEELEKKTDLTVVGGSIGSYASVIGRKEVPRVPKITGVKGPVLPAPKMVIVKSEGKDSKEVEATLKRLVKPAEIGLKVKRLSTIRNGVIIEAEDNMGVDNLISHKGLKDAGLKVGKPTKKNPVVMIYDVGKELNNDEVRQEIFSKNFEGSEISAEDLKKEFEVRHRYRDERSGGKKCHIVVECSVRVRNWLRGKDRIFVEWQSCRVKDYVDVARCFKCQRYGHVAKHCSSDKPDCSFCAGEHDYKDCPNKNKKEKARCVNCMREGREEDKHDAGWRQCPSYERAVKRQNEKTDYGL